MCSIVRATMLVIEIGLYDAGDVLLPACFHSAITLASRQASGTTEWRQEKVKRTDSAAQQSSPAWRRKMGRMASEPGGGLRVLALTLLLHHRWCEGPVVAGVGGDAGEERLRRADVGPAVDAAPQRPRTRPSGSSGGGGCAAATKAVQRLSSDSSWLAGSWPVVGCWMDDSGV